MALNTNLTSNAGLSASMQIYYDRKLIMSAKPKLVHYMYGQARPLPLNSGKTIRFRKWTPFAALTTPLQEGVVPDGQSLSMTEVTATIGQYGGYVAVSDMLSLTAVDPVINDSVELMGDQGGLTIDTLTRDEITNTTSVLYAASSGTPAANRAALTASHKLTTLEIRKAVRVLKKNRAPQFTRGGRGYYVAIVGPDTTFDLQSDPLWQDVSKYAAVEQIFDGEIGKLFGCIFLESSEAKIYTGAGASGIDVAATLVLGKNAFGVVELMGENLHTVIKPRGSAGTADPLDQLSTVGWKAEGFAAKILQPAWIIRIESGISS